MSSIVCSFYGMEILMPRSKTGEPYFEVYYEGTVHKFSMSPCRMLTRENLSPTAQDAISEWTRLHRKELQENWNRIGTGEDFIEIKPIE